MTLLITPNMISLVIQKTNSMSRMVMNAEIGSKDSKEQTHEEQRHKESYRQREKEVKSAKKTF